MSGFSPRKLAADVANEVARRAALEIVRTVVRGIVSSPAAQEAARTAIQTAAVMRNFDATVQFEDPVQAAQAALQLVQRAGGVVPPETQIRLARARRQP